VAGLANHAVAPVPSGGSQHLVNYGSSDCLESLSLSQARLLAGIEDYIRDYPETQINSQEGRLRLAGRIYNTIHQSGLDGKSQEVVATLVGSQSFDFFRNKELNRSGGQFARDVALLKANGATLDEEGLHYEGFRFAAVNPAIKAALSRIYPESRTSIAKLDDPQRHAPIVLGHQVVLGVAARVTGRAFDPAIDLRAMSLDQYNRDIQAYLRGFLNNLRSYAGVANRDASATSLIGAAFFGSGDANSDQSNSLWRIMSNSLSDLDMRYGVPPGTTGALRRAMGQAVREQNRAIRSAVTQVEWAAAAIAAAPAAWPILAVGGSAAAVGMGMGLALSGLDMTVSAASSAAAGRGSFVCNLGKNLMANGGQAFILTLGAGAVASAIPAGTTALTGRIGEQAAARVVTGANVGLVGLGVFEGGRSAYRGGREMVAASADEAAGHPGVAAIERDEGRQQIFHGGRVLALSTIPIAANPGRLSSPLTTQGSVRKLRRGGKLILEAAQYIGQVDDDQ
jgi:hypothetical protein